MCDHAAMKTKGLIWPLVILLGACNEKPAADAGAAHEKKAKQTNPAQPQAGSGEDAEADGKDGKSGARPDRPKKPAMGSVAPGQPGKAISPYSNQAVDVKGLAAGALVQDPKFPGDESKKFIVPDGVEVDPAERPEAKPVPGKPGVVFSPYNNQMVNVEGFRAGSVVADPTYPASERKYFRVPPAAVAPPAEEDTGADGAEGGAAGGAIIGAGGGAFIGGGEQAPPPQEE